MSFAATKINKAAEIIDWLMFHGMPQKLSGVVKKKKVRLK